MSEHLRPSAPAPAPASAPSHSPTLHATDTKYEGQDPEEDLTIGTRTPKPYYRQSFELLEPSERLIHRAATVALSQTQPSSTSPHSSNQASDSGTEADDEHFLKGLPAPKTRLHKGLRGRNEPLSGTSTPLLSPNAIDEDGRDPDLNPRSGISVRLKRSEAETARRRKEVVRRGAEVLLLACQGWLVASNYDVQPFIRTHRKELSAFGWLFSTLLALYPLRLVAWAYRQGKPSKPLPVSVPTSFDPAPALYPQLIPLFVSLLVAKNVEGVVLPNVILSICSLPRPLIPGAGYWEEYSSTQWLLSCIPLVLGSSATDSEILTLLYPLHQTLCLLLQRLTTTSLLIAELQLLSVALINVLLLARSPQVVILKALLWGGGLGIIVLCSKVIQWGISLARVPKWRFKRPSIPKAGSTSGLWKFFKSAKRTYFDGRTDNEEVLSDSDYWLSGHNRNRRSATPSWDASFLKGRTRENSISSAEENSLRQTNGVDVRFDVQQPPSPQQFSPRRHTLPSLGKIASIVRSQTSTPSGRRKRSASSSVRAFFSLTQAQATVRKWLYAGWVYICILIVILVGVREYVGRYALAENEPVGWALGYLFGDIPEFRLEIVKADLERWICLPIRTDDEASDALGGWVQFVRQSILGEANTRLLLSGYWLVVIIIGLAVVFRLSPIYEVDTRRKVFHFMMVAMFLPTIFIDPTYIALALSIVLAVFLLVDLLRASQLPPLSTPIAQFLTPYVDGRDLRGPVVISHIFLLIGCAIPLWLSLAALPRVGEGPLVGWEVPLRDISMVAGVVCVGLGDAAASLIGRRWGHRKWLWGGGKSIEGSIAFATAVFVGLMTANIWLFVGGWPSTDGMPSTVAQEAVLNDSLEVGTGTGVGELVMDIMGRLWEGLSQLPQASWSTTVVKTAACACMASLTEAVLTGGNDNVVVPVVLWTCVKSMDMNLR
ncbi:hypothetical protein SMACR_02622 [Sordaria macrospora]|uniref:dolichol kinase n=2 Tax=Sordaria macrospora TaxID=5147 RepID=F7VX02_SORMK|nr:uncharacterized protein SMAC_02622 [Sordaria macrospora k-hell]KAA8636440.1 hypothetical protein SMACR_02622 [Sordaria macrospora]KAH7633002.1 hypothetical protein B0T09DRAFT_258201 [Sordaria sp. MPI-SDFR-AT-0083]WPJ60548.1 hypothetical protein SMAC4_02622 [Sordaria macrospora]CCC10043.1 unnamed protein product [Sordaria macrospora k-hell]